MWSRRTASLAQQGSFYAVMILCLTFVMNSLDFPRQPLPGVCDMEIIILVIIIGLLYRLQYNMCEVSLTLKELF